MAKATVPHFRNDEGVEKIRIGTGEFKCTGTSPPFDHPHVYLDMGDENQIVCPYCSTLFERSGELGQNEADPAACAYPDGVV